jgi:urease accessory protein
MTRSTDPGGRTPGLHRLLAWASPSFPTGAFSYSHGLEAAVSDGTVHDRASLQAWIAAVAAHGSGRTDADILCAAHHAASGGDRPTFDAANRRGIAFRATAELALESAQQGDAFLQTCQAAWPDAFIEAWRESPHPNPPPQAGEGRVGAAPSEAVCHSAAFGAATARAGIALADALVAYLHAFAGNLVSAGIRLGVIGQTDGQRILAAMEPVVAAATKAALSRDPADFGAATFAVDLASMAHETQYSRLFRS